MESIRSSALQNNSSLLSRLVECTRAFWQAVLVASAMNGELIIILTMNRLFGFTTFGGKAYITLYFC